MNCYIITNTLLKTFYHFLLTFLQTAFFSSAVSARDQDCIDYPMARLPTFNDPINSYKIKSSPPHHTHFVLNPESVTLR